MNTKNNFLLTIIFACSTLNCITSHAQEEKSADIVQQKSLLSFLPQETSGAQVTRRSVQVDHLNLFDHKKRGESVDFCMIIPNTPIDWDNVPKIERLLKLIAKKDTPVHEGTVSKEIADKIGLLDDTKTLQENFIHAVKNQEYKRVVNCLVLEQYFNKNKKNINPANSLIEHTKSNYNFKQKFEYMMCCDPELLLLVIQDRKIHNKRISDWKFDNDYGNLLYFICTLHRMFNPFHDHSSSLNLNVIQILIDEGVDPNGASPGAFTPLHTLCGSNTAHGHMPTTSQKIKAAQMLLLAGADSSIQNQYHNTPRRIAIIHGEYDLAAFLENFTIPEPEPEIVTFKNEESFENYMKSKSNSSN